LRVHFRIILPSTPRSLKWPFSFNFSHRNNVRVCSVYHKYHKLHQFNLSGLRKRSVTSDEEHKLWSSTFCISFQSSVTLSLLGPKHPQPMFFPQCDRPSFTSIQNNKKCYISLKWEDANFWTERVHAFSEFSIFFFSFYPPSVPDALDLFMHPGASHWLVLVPTPDWHLLPTLSLPSYWPVFWSTSPPFQYISPFT
jgi:hypothetical protein